MASVSGTCALLTANAERSAAARWWMRSQPTVRAGAQRRQAHLLMASQRQSERSYKSRKRLWRVTTSLSFAPEKLTNASRTEVIRCRRKATNGLHLPQGYEAMPG